MWFSLFLGRKILDFESFRDLRESASLVDICRGGFSSFSSGKVDFVVLVFCIFFSGFRRKRFLIKFRDLYKWWVGF